MEEVFTKTLSEVRDAVDDVVQHHKNLQSCIPMPEELSRMSPQKLIELRAFIREKALSSGGKYSRELSNLLDSLSALATGASEHSKSLPNTPSTYNSKKLFQIAGAASLITFAVLYPPLIPLLGFGSSFVTSAGAAGAAGTIAFLAAAESGQLRGTVSSVRDGAFDVSQALQKFAQSTSSMEDLVKKDGTSVVTPEELVALKTKLEESQVLASSVYSAITRARHNLVSKHVNS